MLDSLIALLATVLVPGGAVILVPYLILRATENGPAAGSGPLEWGSVALALIGAAMVLWVSFAFVTRGRGTPVPVRPPREFVAHGLYRYVRNPMYVGALLILFAEAVYFRSAWLLLYAGVVWAALHTFTILLEEPQLEDRFGDAYRRYKGQTARWVPRRPRPPEGGT